MNLKRLIPLYLGAVIAPMGGIGILPLIPVMARHWSIEFGTIALAVPFYMIPFVLFLLLSGSIAQLFEVRKTLLFGFALYALGSLFCGLSPSLWILMGSRMVQGVGAAFIVPITMALIGELVPEQHVGKGIGVLGVAYTIGVTLGPLISGFMEVSYGWPGFFFFLAAVSFIAGVLYGTSSGTLRPAGAVQSGFMAFLSMLKTALHQPGVLYLSFSAFSFFIAYIGIMTFTADHLHSHLQLPSGRIGTLLSIAGFSGVIVSPVAGFLGDRTGRIRVFAAGGGVVLLCIALMNAVEFSYWRYFSLFLLFGTGGATAWTSLNAMAVEISPAYRQSVASIYNSLKFAGYALSPVILSVLYGPFHLRAVQWGCMTAILIAILLALGAPARSRETFEGFAQGGEEG